MLENVVKKLIEQKRTIATMESCTGGGLANAITNIEGSSEVFHFGAVTYSNDYKVAIGVPSSVIDTYTVYSMETAIAMARAIQSFTKSSFGVGITGKLSVPDPSNQTGKDNQVFICIYDARGDKEYTMEFEVQKEAREENKEYLIQEIGKKLEEIL